MDKNGSTPQPRSAVELIEEVLRKRILFIGDNPPAAASEGRECVQIYSGCPNDLIRELNEALRSVAGGEPTLELCGEHAQSWNCERNHLPADTCVVCAFAKAWADVIDKLADEQSSKGHCHTAVFLQEVVAHKIRQSTKAWQL